MSKPYATNLPLLWLRKLTQRFVQEPKSRAELLQVLQDAYQNKLLDSDALTIIEGAIQVADLQVRDIMVPRSQVVGIQVAQSPKEFLPTVIETAHSRYPVTGEHLDDVLGILLAKDLLPLIIDQQQEDFSISALLRPATFVPESKRLNVLLKEFRANRQHMAVVIDEYGGVSGLVTIEDVLEQIVGEIDDEHDNEPEHYIKPLPNGEFIVKALTPTEQFNQFFNCQFAKEYCTTVGGLVTNAFGYLPKRNESIELAEFRFRVLNADSRRIHSLRITPLKSS